MTTNQTIDGVPREFVREGRYIVVKPDYEDDIRTERLRNYIEEMCFHTPDCVVVEADWPEYEPVWRMIEARVIGNPTELDAAKATISKLQGLVAELRALLDAPAPDNDDIESERGEALSIYDDAMEACAEVERDGVPGDVIREMNDELATLRAAQPQGEPVARLGVHHVLGAIHNVPGFPGVKGNHIHDLTALLNGVLASAEQPAPVAVVIDDNVEFEKWWMSTPILRKQKIQVAQEAWFARANLSK